MRKNRWKPRIHCQIQQVLIFIKPHGEWLARLRKFSKNLIHGFAVAAGVNMYVHRKLYQKPGAALSRTQQRRECRRRPLRDVK